jgi:hypothetical protein
LIEIIGEDIAFDFRLGWTRLVTDTVRRG